MCGIRDVAVVILVVFAVYGSFIASLFVFCAVLSVISCRVFVHLYKGPCKDWALRTNLGYKCCATWHWPVLHTYLYKYKH